MANNLRPTHGHTTPLAAATAVAVALLLGGCADYNSEMKPVMGAWVVGDNQRAADIATSLTASNSSGADYIVFGLESGAALRAAGQFEHSNQQFEAIEVKMSEYSAGADIRLAAEAGAALSNLSFLPYTGTSYDKVMVSTYRALNDLQLRDYQSARVNLNRSLEYQREAVRENARAIEAANKVAASDQDNSANLDVERTRHSAELSGQLSSVYAQMASMRAYADYVNPFAVLLDGLYHLYQGTDNSDLERARVSLQRVRDMADTRTFIEQDLQSVANAQQGKIEETPLTYVIFETGMAPRRDEIRIDLPLFIFGITNVPYFGVAFPRLVPEENYAPHLQIDAAGRRYTTEQVCRMDSVVSRDFENGYDLIITKTIVSAGIKAAATYALAEAGRQAGGNTGEILGNLILVVGTAYQAAMNQADLRTWQTLPKYFEYARFPTPADGKLTLTPSGGGGSVTVDLEPAAVGVVYVKSNARAAPLTVFQFPLKD